MQLVNLIKPLLADEITCGHSNLVTCLGIYCVQQFQPSFSAGAPSWWSSPAASATDTELQTGISYIELLLRIHLCTNCSNCSFICTASAFWHLQRILSPSPPPTPILTCSILSNLQLCLALRIIFPWESWVKDTGRSLMYTQAHSHILHCLSFAIHSGNVASVVDTIGQSAETGDLCF